MNLGLTCRRDWWRPSCDAPFRLCFFIVQLFIYQVHGQIPDTVFRRPLDIPVALSGNFAELRDNHFHSGIDFRTQGVTGHKIYACGEGYVSRISVSPSGFGHALYITHPNGYTTVYGHLEAFNDDITAYVRNQQYQQERFSVNLFPDPLLFPMKKGDLIAFSGNTGSSGGPHLHFEIRDTKTENPVNPLMFGLGVKDNIPPVMQRLAIYPMSEGSTVNGSANKLILNLEKAGNHYRIAGGKKISISGKFAFGIDAYDQISGSSMRCGIYNIRCRVDSVLVFSQTMNRFSFDESRYINSLIDYDYYVKHRVRINRMYIEPNNRLSVYDRHIRRGIVSFPDTALHTVSVVVQDFHGNSSGLSFTFEYTSGKDSPPVPLYVPDITSVPGINRTMYQRELIHVQQGLSVVIPADALYDDILFTCSVSKQPKGLYSKAYRIHHPGTPLHKAMTVEIAADSLPERLHEKALIVQMDSTGRYSSAGGAYSNGVVRGNPGVFGEYAIGVDTIPPRITPVNIRNGANMRGIKDIRFKISDELSGINTYSGWIDGQWALFEYDAKNKLLYYVFDADRLTKNTQHTLELKVSDAKGNTAEYRTKFNR